MTTLRALPRPSVVPPPAGRTGPRLRRRKPGRGPKHDLWVVPYADMMTLLFAMFVVLYALGKLELDRFAELRRAIAFAFHYDGATSGRSEDGTYENGASGGQLLEGVELVNAQWGPMVRFLHDALADRFEQMSGTSLDIVTTDDTVTVTAPLDAYFAAGEISVREDAQVWLVQLFEGIWDHASDVRVRIEVPDVPIGKDRSGRQIRAEELSGQRLERLRALLRRIPAVDPRRVVTELALLPPTIGDWEHEGRLTFAFSNP